LADLILFDEFLYRLQYIHDTSKQSMFHLSLVKVLSGLIY